MVFILEAGNLSGKAVVLILAGIELIFFIVAHMVLIYDTDVSAVAEQCVFGVKNSCFSQCPSASRLGVCEKLGGGDS